jgi:hypothetical protein
VNFVIKNKTHCGSLRCFDKTSITSIRGFYGFLAKCIGKKCFLTSSYFLSFMY